MASPAIPAGGSRPCSHSPLLPDFSLGRCSGQEACPAQGDTSVATSRVHHRELHFHKDETYQIKTFRFKNLHKWPPEDQWQAHIWKRLFSTPIPSGLHGGTQGQAEPSKGKAELLGRALAAGDITHLWTWLLLRGREKAP